MVLKAVSLGMRIIEVPAVLEWKEHKARGRAVKRKSSSKLPKLIGSHLTFSAVAVPVRYFWSAGLISGSVRRGNFASLAALKQRLLDFILSAPGRGARSLRNAATQRAILCDLTSSLPPERIHDIVRCL